MTRLLYIANARIPTEKAHGLQIMQNCEAFADNGADVTLWTAARINTPELRGVTDAWAHYGVRRSFALRRLPCIDLLPLAQNSTALSRVAFLLQQASFVIVVLLAALFARVDVYYSRDALIVLVLSLLKPRRALAYEPHRLAEGRAGRWLQRRAIRRAGSIFPVTKRLADDLIVRGANPARVMTAHDGIRRERFASLPSETEARGALGWPPDAFIVGYIGRLHTLSLDKGVSLLVEALSGIDGAALALVGGPAEMADSLRGDWLARGKSGELFFNVGQVSPDRVPLYLAALDVCAMPFPRTEHFAYHASPMKLFEYMASRRAIVASDLPATAEVVRDGESALLYPPGDAAALRAAVRRLKDDPALRARLADCAYETVMQHYTWDTRAQSILAKIAEAGA